MENWMVGLLGGVACMLLVLVALLFAARKREVEALDLANSALRDADRMRSKLKEPREDVPPAVRIVLSEMSDEVLANSLSAGPTASIWKGVLECARRLKDRYTEDSDMGASTASKASAMDRMNALDELIVLMDQWYREAQQKAG